MKKIATLILCAMLGSGLTIGGLYIFNTTINPNKSLKIEHINNSAGAVLTLNNKGEVVPLDFTGAAESVMPAVVHITSTQTLTANQTDRSNPFRDFYGDDDFFEKFFGPSPKRGPQPRVGTGSGVIINTEGYIVTNNHVIENADDIEVTLYNKESYKAKVIGTDPSTDLALLQISAKNLSSIPLVNSDNVKVGEWVLAVGNPFNLTSTVTAGIVSAKGRNINILHDQAAIESFIQTDAAINPGNSGGALVSLNGGLIGINTAIASPTGAYSGYGFAVPSNIVSKVVEDLLKFGVVQRGFLGITIRGVDGKLAKEKNLDVSEGVYVDSLAENSAAKSAGIKQGDVILKVDGIEVKSAPELQEIIGRHRPGDKVTLHIDRNGKEKAYNVILNNREGNTKVVKKEQKEIITILGAEFENIDRETAKKLEINSGVRVTKLHAGKLRKYTDMKEGFIITKIDGKPVKNIDDLVSKLEHKKGGIMLEGMYENYPGTYYYAFGM